MFMNMYSNRFFQVQTAAENKLLILTWSKASQTLDTEEVKKEISTILYWIDEQAIENIIVDACDYYFTENIKIQSWITSSFIPKVMETSVKKYAIVIKKMEKGYENDSLDDNDQDMQVAYFTSFDGAQKWIDVNKVTL